MTRSSDFNQLDPNTVLIDGYTTVGEWPNCPTPDCENKVCLWARTGRCYPCSEAELGVVEMDKRYTETHSHDV